MGDTNTGQRPMKLKTKIRLMNPDASMLQDTSQLDVSKDASYMLGDVFAQQPTKEKVLPFNYNNNIFGANKGSASPSSDNRGSLSNVPPTPVIGGRGGQNDFFADMAADNSFNGFQ